jgi:hypothetical protein
LLNTVLRTASLQWSRARTISHDIVN